MAYEFAQYKSPAAVAERPQNLLPSRLLETCRKQRGDFDKLASYFALYHHAPAELALVLCPDKVYKCGFARMRLVQNLHRPKQPFAEFLSSEVATKTLAAFDGSQADNRLSELKQIVVADAEPLVFIRRGPRPGKVLQERRLVHGYLRDWIVLGSLDAAKRFCIASKSIAEPLKIVERISSAYCGAKRTYHNDTLVAYPRTLRALSRAGEGVSHQPRAGRLPQVPAALSEEEAGAHPRRGSARLSHRACPAHACARRVRPVR